MHELSFPARHENCSDNRPTIWVATRNPGEHVTHEVHPATLPRSTLNDTSMARTRPACASLMTSCTPPRPRRFRSRKNSVQNGSDSVSPTWNPSTCRCPSAATPTAITIAWDAHPATDPCFAVGCVNEHVRVGGVVEAALTKLSDVLVKLLADA